MTGQIPDNPLEKSLMLERACDRLRRVINDLVLAPGDFNQKVPGDFRHFAPEDFRQS